MMTRGLKIKITAKQGEKKPHRRPAYPTATRSGIEASKTAPAGCRSHGRSSPRHKSRHSSRPKPATCICRNRRLPWIRAKTEPQVTGANASQRPEGRRAGGHPHRSRDLDAQSACGGWMWFGAHAAHRPGDDAPKLGISNQACPLRMPLRLRSCKKQPSDHVHEKKAARRCVRCNVISPSGCRALAATSRAPG